MLCLILELAPVLYAGCISNYSLAEALLHLTVPFPSLATYSHVAHTSRLRLFLGAPQCHLSPSAHSHESIMNTLHT